MKVDDWKTHLSELLNLSRCFGVSPFIRKTRVVTPVFKKKMNCNVPIINQQLFHQTLAKYNLPETDNLATIYSLDWNKSTYHV